MTKFPNPICYQHNPSLELLCARQAEEDPNHDHDTVTDLVPLRLGHHIVLVCLFTATLLSQTTDLEK